MLNPNFNLLPDGDKKEDGISVIYIDLEDEEIIKKRIGQYQYKNRNQDKIIVYHMTSHGIQCYDKLYNDEINNPNLTRSFGEIM